MHIGVDNWEWCLANLSMDVINAEKGAFLVAGNVILQTFQGM